MINGFRTDLVFALRTLRGSPAFTAVALIALTVGIGANTSVFTIVDALLNFPVPFSEPERAAFIYTEHPELGVSQNGGSADEVLDWQERSRSFEAIGAGAATQVNLVGDGEPVRLVAARFSPEFWRIAAPAMAMGRGFSSNESRERVVVLRYALWQQRYAGDPQILGRTISIDGEMHTVVGVTARGFFFPQNVQLWLPLHLERGASRQERPLFAVALLKEGIDSEAATVEMRGIAEQLAQQYPDSNAGWTVRVQTLRENFTAGVAFASILLYGAITFVLLIACANVANLMLSRSVAREREMALRASLGAARMRVVRQLLTESVALALLGGVFGVVLSIFGVRFLKTQVAADPNIGFIATAFELDRGVLGHALLMCVVAGVIFGLAPALQLSRPNLSGVLREGGPGGSSRRRRWLRSAFITAQVAFSLGLLGASGAMIRGFSTLYSEDPGFRVDALLTLQLSQDRSPEGRQLAEFYRQALDGASAIPGVDAATATSVLPLTALPGAATAVVRVPGSEVEVRTDQPNALDIVVTPGYFETMGIELLRGRGFSAADSAGGQAVAVVTPGLVERLFEGQDPLGRQIEVRSIGQKPVAANVVGIVSEVRNNSHSLRSPSPTPTVFLPFDQHPQKTMTLVLRSSRDPGSLAQDLRSVIWALDDQLPVGGIATMRDVVHRIDTQNRFLVGIFAALSLIALLLAGVGIYGVISYNVGQRANEIGIRMALGARPSRVMALVVRQAAVLTGVGLAVGTLIAYGLVRFMSGQLEGLAAANATGPTTLGGVALVLLLVAQLASWIPVRRAVRIDPVRSLRGE